MWVLGASGDVPVDPADVVAGFVPSGLPGVTAATGHQTHEVAVQHSVELPGDIESQAADDLLGGPVADQAQGVR